MTKYVSLDNLTRYDGKIKEYIGTATASFITKSVNDLTNYYLKSETYTKSEVNSLISAISTIDIVVVQTLPTEDISTSTIYLVPKSTSQTSNVYDEYIYVSNSWEKIGDTQIDLSDYVTETELATELSGKQDTIDSSHKVSADLIDDSNTTNKFINASDITKLSGIESGAEVNVQSDWSETDTTDDAYIKNKPTIPTKVSDLTNDAGYITGMTILTYGTSTWQDFITAYNANRVVYTRVSGRLAFMAYVNNGDNPTNVEFQYYRSSSSPSYSSQADEVFVYKLTSSGSWTTTTREASTKTTVGSNTGLDYTYSASSRQLTLSGPQRSTMPTASSTYNNRIFQYIGTTNSNYTNGYFYKCTNSSGSYKWEQLEVQPSSGGAKYVINIEYTNLSERRFSNYNTEDNRNVFQQIYNNYSNIKAGDVVVAVKYNNATEIIYNVEQISLRSNQLRISLKDVNTSGSSGVYNVWYRSYIVNDFYSNFSNDVVGNIENYRGVQYIPVNNESILGVNNTTAYTPTGDYNPATKKYVDDSVATKQDILQYSTMPTPDSSTVGKIIQYIGTTDNTYTNGYFYIGTTDGESTPTYSWEQIDVQPSSSGGGTWGSITGTLSDQEDLNDELLMRPVINPTIIIGSSNYSTPLIIDELDPGAYFIKNTGGNGTNYVRLDSSIQSSINLQCVGSGYDGEYNSGVYLYIPKAIDYSNLTDGDTLFYVNTDKNTYDNGYMVDAILTYVYDSTVTSKMKIDETKTISKGIGLPLTQGTQGFYGKKTFYSGIASDIEPLEDKDLTTKKYVDTSHPIVYLSKDVYPNPWSYNDLWDLEYNPSYPYTFAYGGEGWNDYWTNTHSTTTSRGTAYIKMNFPEQLVGKEVTVNYEFTVPSGATGYARIYYNTTSKVSKSSSATGSFTISSVASGDYITLNCQKLSDVSGITLNVYFTFPDLLVASQIYAIKCSKVAKEIYDEVISNYNADLGTTSKTYILELRGPDRYEGEPDYSTDVIDKNLLFRYISKSGTTTSIRFENIPTLTTYDDISIVNITYNSGTDTYSLEGPYYADEGSFKQFLKIYDDDYHTKAKALILEDIPRKDFTIGKTDVNTSYIYVKAHSSDANTKALKLTDIVGNIINWKNTIEDIDTLGTEMSVLTYSVGTVYDSTSNKICTQRNTLYYDPETNTLRLDEVKTPLDLTIPDSIQVSTMPTASSTLEGNVVQYIGATDNTYTKGYFYECVSDGESTPTYSWQNIDVCDVPEDFVLGLISNSTTLPNSGTSSQPIILSTMSPGKYRVVGSRTIYVKLDTTSTTTTSRNIGSGYFILPRKIDTSNLSDGDVVAHFEAYGMSSGSLQISEYDLLYKPNETSGVLFSGGVGNITMASGIVTTSSAQTISGTKTFSSIPSCSVTPTSNNHLVNKSYVDGIVGNIQTALEALVDGSSS